MSESRQPSPPGARGGLLHRRGRVELNATAPRAAVEPALRRLRRRKAPWLIVAAIVVIGAGVAVVLAGSPFSGGKEGPGAAGNADPTGLSTVTRRNLSSQTELSATLGYADSYNVVNQAEGTITWLPAVGHVVSQGQGLYQVSGAPVVLLYGQTPAYRALSEDMTGADVVQLNDDLVALGYATHTELPSGTDGFTYRTKVGLEKLQTAVDDTPTGTLALGQAVFLPAAIRVTAVSATLGGPAQAGHTVLSATSTSRQVSIALDASQQSEVAVGDMVTITLPNNQTTPGRISSVGTVAAAPAPGSSSTSPTITVLVEPTNPADTGTWDQAPVNVTITTGTVSNVLVVPVDSLLAQPGGSYAVEVAGTDGIHHLAPVTLGLFDDADGLVQVSGSQLDAGQHVVVPKL